MNGNLEWFGHAGHFICGDLCRFHLTTLVNEKWVVSTVGEMWPERSSREIAARVYDPAWLVKNGHLKGDEFDAAYMMRFGYADIGCDRKYETMVFAWTGKRCVSAKCACGLPTIDPSELDFGAYNTAGEATKGHRAMVEKWSSIEARPTGETK